MRGAARAYVHPITATRAHRASFASDPKPTVCINLSRTTAPSQAEHEHNKTNLSDGLYSLAEDLKDGITVNTKHEGRTLLFDVPQVIFFADFEADHHKGSHDRCNVVAL